LGKLLNIYEKDCHRKEKFYKNSYLESLKLILNIQNDLEKDYDDRKSLISIYIG